MATVVFLVSVVVLFLVGTVIHGKWESIVKAGAAAVMVAVLAFGPTIRASAPLRAFPLRFLGRVSYSFYLLHPLTIPVIATQSALFGRWVEPGVPAFPILLALWLATTVAALPLARLMYRTVEVPFVRFGKRFWKMPPRVSGSASSAQGSIP